MESADTRFGNLAGAVALVTGSSRNIGQAIVEGFAREGAKVAINHLNDPEASQTLAEHILKRGGEAMVCLADVRKEHDVAKMIREIADRFGGVDILVNNAGIVTSSAIVDMSWAQWDDMIQTHLGGAFNCSRSVLPHMIARKYGRIINISGTFGIVGGAQFCHLSAAKAGLIGFTRALAREVGSYGITVNALAPGYIRTDRYEALDLDLQRSVIASYPLRRVGELADITSAVLFLASEAGAFFTGQTLSPSGGDVMR